MGQAWLMCCISENWPWTGNLSTIHADEILEEGSEGGDRGYCVLKCSLVEKTKLQNLKLCPSFC